MSVELKKINRNSSPSAKSSAQTAFKKSAFSRDRIQLVKSVEENEASPLNQAELEDSAQLVLEAIPFVMRSIRFEMRTAARGVFTVPQFRVFNQLSKSPQTNRQLADWMGVTPPTMSRMVDVLVRRGFVERTRDPEDLRTHSLSATELGRKEMNRARLVVRRRIAEKVGRLDPEKITILSVGIKILKEAFS